MGLILDVNELSVARGKSILLDQIEWQVKRGEHWAILGANGSGKTSLLKALTGYLSPTRGNLALLGRRYGSCDWRDLRLKVGVVMSAFATSIPPAERAIDTVVSGKFAQLDLWQRGTRSDTRMALRLLRAARLEAIAEREWLYLSQGERQRVLIARALMARPRLLILDEPCAGLDPVARENFLRFIEELAQTSSGNGSRGSRAPTLVLVTHHVEEITPSFTHVLLLRDGKVHATGKRDHVLTSTNLSTTFGATLRLTRSGERYRLDVVSA